MASTDAKPFSIKNTAYRVTFPILDADGDLVAGAAGLNSEISKDGGTFTDCANEATQIATASGMYYLDLTATEMNADTVAIIVKTSTSGAKTTPIVLYPVENTDIPVNVKAISDDTTAPDNLELMYDGTGYAGGTAKLEVDIVKLLGTAWLTPGVAGTPDVNTKLLGGTAQTGNDVGADVNDILTDTGTTLDTLIKDIPTVAEFEARSILAANYVVVGDTIAGVTAVTNDVGITQAGADKVRASVCVTGDPANSIGKILYELYINRLTSTRAGYLDNLSAGAVALASGVDLTKIHGAALTETVNGYLAAAFTKLFDVATPLLVASEAMRGTNSAALAASYTATRAGYIDNINNAHLATIADISSLTATEIAYLNASISSRSSHAASAIWSVGTRALTDKAGFNLSAAGITAIWEKNISAFSGVGYVGTYVKTLYDDWINAGRLDAILDTIAADVVNIDGDAMRGTDGANTTTPPTVNAIADQVWDEMLTGATHNIATSAGKRLRELSALSIHAGTAQAGTAMSIMLAADANGADGIYNRNLIVIVGGTGAGQTRTIADYDNTTKVCIIDRNWRTNPDATSEYQILADDTPLVVDHGVAQAGTATTITLRDYASSTDNIYLCNIVIILGGMGRGQSRLVGSYNGTSKVVTICGENWETIPDNTSVYAMIPYGTTCTSCVGTYALGQIADAAWDELQSGHTDAGSFGKYLDAQISTIGGEVGPGALSCTWTQKDDDENPMDNVQIWITTDEVGTNVIAGTLLTDASGEATFMLDAGTYYVWRERAGYNFTNPQTWTVS